MSDNMPFLRQHHDIIVPRNTATIIIVNIYTYYGCFAVSNSLIRGEGLSMFTSGKKIVLRVLVFMAVLAAGVFAAGGSRSHAATLNIKINGKTSY